jgi:hypothetical protein
MAIIKVGAGQVYTTLGAAVDAAASGDEIDVQAGIYKGVENMPIINDKSLDFVAVGGRVTVTADPVEHEVNQSKGMFIINPGADGDLPNISITGFDFRGATSSFVTNAAAIRDFGSNLMLANDGFYDNDEGILSGGTTGNITIDHSVFKNNGYTGQEHNLYIGQAQNLTVTNSLFDGTMGQGHEIKSRALNTTITGNRILDADSQSSYSIDLPSGGNAVIQNNVIEQGPNGGNPHVFAYAEETQIPLAMHSPLGMLISSTLLLPEPEAVAPGARAVELVAETLAAAPVGLAAAPVGEQAGVQGEVRTPDRARSILLIHRGRACGRSLKVILMTSPKWI